MLKPASLHAALTAALPELARDPERMTMVIKTGSIMGRQLKRAVIEHQVAFYRVNARLAHLLQQQPQALNYQLGVAPPLNIQIAMQHPIAHCTIRPHGRAPRVSSAQHIQRRRGGYQLHHRGRVHRALAMQINQWRTTISRHYQQADLRGGYTRTRQSCRHTIWNTRSSSQLGQLWRRCIIKNHRLRSSRTSCLRRRTGSTGRHSRR